MALKRLPNDVQSLLCASVQVNSYKRAIEELIHNSLDAKSTSIAIRIHIQESTIQVIDNGYGIVKHDLDLIGQRYMTSKVTDVATLKAAPKNYGYRGEFLANIIAVSQMVKVTSRHESTGETWAKTFINGKEKMFAQMTTRPTKGTTVDIKGFLYNLNIQKRGIDSINELQNIKSFLEQLSVVHNHISLSLRDDSQNEIVFKIHKKRDIYQTFMTLFNIDKTHVIELQVEKHEYKVKGYTGRTYNELDLHWIFLNGKYIHNCSKLHKVLNEHFKKYLYGKGQRTLKSMKNNYEHRLFNQDMPFYFIFVTCPYIDYDVSHTPKQSVLEFKNWEQINKLLEKFVKFYAGDNNVIEMKKVEEKLMNTEPINTKVNQDTRDQVKKIMDKILGCNSKHLGVSQLQNGIKGKMVKRKVKKKTNRTAIIPKLFLQSDKKYNNDDNASLKSNIEVISEDNIEKHIQHTVDDFEKKKEYNTLANPRNHKQRVKIPGSIRYKTKEIQIHKKKKEIKFNILSPTKKKYKAEVKPKHTLNKHKKVKVNNNEIKNVEGTDSVCKRSKIVAQKVEDFLHHTKNRNFNAHQSKNEYRQYGNENTKFWQKKYCATNDNLTRPPKTNKYLIEKYVINKLKTKSYKTTYDLVQTVLIGQKELLNASSVENNMSQELYWKFHRRGDILRCINIAPRRYTWTNKYIFSDFSNNDHKKEIVSQYTTNIPVQYKTYEYKNNDNEYSLYVQKDMSDYMMTNVSERLEFIDNEKNICSQIQKSFCTQKETSYRTLSGPSKVLTYDSHQYHKNEVYVRNDTENCYTINKRQNARFITKESTDNFVTFNHFKNRFKYPFKTTSNKQTKTFDIRMKQTIDESYTIGYSKSNENNYNTADNYIVPNSVEDNDYYEHAIVSYEPVSPINHLNPVLGNTYTIHRSNSSFEKNLTTENEMKRRQNIQPTGLLRTYSVHDSHSEVNQDNNGFKTTKDDFPLNSKNNIVFVSNSQHSETVPSANNMIVDPLNVCETELYEMGSDEKEFAVSFNENNQLKDSLYGNIKEGTDKHVQSIHVISTEGIYDITENVSHHFSCAVKTKQPNIIVNISDDNLEDLMEKHHNKITKRVIRAGDLPFLNNEGNFDAGHNDCNFENNFNLKNRPRFLPKGMSQIFENCRTKTACNYNMDKDYFEDSIYNNFANDVQVNSEIYEPIIQNVEDFTTKNIHNFQNKVKKDNASLVFDETSLKEAKVLGQADSKFIAAIMKKRCDQSKEYLILFDQHAVDERIRLEKNLADYLNEERWTSVTVDNFILKISKDEILYLHNYKDKFTQLGLKWTILNDNEVTVHSIPEAILGKNPREVEKVIKAVKNVIAEEINVIKLQKGCVSLYLKSIMDLICSESCRYAFKFGDQLSKRDCVELLNALSNCKTPFQCAHGRPVMAVIVDIIADKREYKINMEALHRFRKISTTKTSK